MPKGRGSNKKGQGPTAPRQAPVINGIPPQVELLVLKQQIESLILEKNMMQGQITQIVQLLIGTLLTKKGNTATLTPAVQGKILNYAGVGTIEQDDGSVVLELTLKEEDDVPETP